MNFQFWNEIIKGNAENLIRTGLLLIVGLPLIYFLASAVRRLAARRVSDQSLMLIGKVIIYGGWTIIGMTALRELGFDLSTLIGAAGIAGAAIGFASQTSLSNVISGFFLLWEKPFKIGDLVKVGDNTGHVFSMDLLSVYIRTFDNQLIRIPNETLIKASFTNVSRFPIRRMDLPIGVAYKEDVSHVLKVLRGIASANPYCLDEPEPVIIFKGFGDSALEFMLGIWFAKDDYVMLRNTILHEVKDRFDAEGIEIPFPHLTLYTGAVTKPFPIEIATPPSPPGEQPTP